MRVVLGGSFWNDQSLCNDDAPARRARIATAPVFFNAMGNQNGNRNGD